MSIDQLRPPTVASWRPLRIAMIGQKGLPATHGGVEHVVSETGRRLAERGHQVTVYCRRSYGELPESPYLGMQVVGAPTVARKHLDAIVHSATSTAMALASQHDVIHYHALGPGLLAPLPRYLSNSKVVLTVHGLDHRRGKWGPGAQTVLRAAHWMSGRVPDRTIVVSDTLRQHYAEAFNRDTDYIPNGVSAPVTQGPKQVSELGLRPGRYLLFVGRIVPEKAPDQLLEAFRRVAGHAQLAIVGDSSWTDEFAAQVRTLAARDPRVVLTGFRYDDCLAALYEHAGAFVQPSLEEGLPLTLLEAISHGTPVLVSDIGPHLEVLGPLPDATGTTFRAGDTDDLADALRTVVGTFGRSRGCTKALQRQVMGRYDWDVATDQLEQVYLSLVPPGSKHSTTATRSACP